MSALGSEDTTGVSIRVGIVDDHALYREMLATVLGTQPGIEVVASAEGAAQARRLITPGSVDVAILDVELGDGNGLGLGVQLRRADPRLGILLLSSHDVMDFLLDLPSDVRLGWSYLSKTSPLAATQTIAAAVRATARGETVLDPMLVERAKPRKGTSLAALSTRQYQVLQRVARGLSNAGVAHDLGISARSVENHLNVVYAVLGLPEGYNQRVSAVLRFIEDTSRD